MPDTPTPIAIVAFLAIAFVLPIVHVWTSKRTPANMRLWYVLGIVAFGPFCYALWWMTNQTTPSSAAVAATLAAAAAPDPGKAALVLTRDSFYGILRNYPVFVDDTKAPVAQIRGRSSVTVAVAPGPHTLYVKVGKLLEYPFDARAGETLVFSLNARADNPISTSVVGWVTA